MNHIRIKLIVGGIAVAAAVALLAVAGVREGWVYYLPVDQFIAETDYHAKRVRLHGVVGEENLEVNSSLLIANFDLLGETGRVRIQYSGVVPDMFKPGHDVVVEGRLGEANTFIADTLMTKCASKYESAEGQAPHADPRATTGGE